MNRPTPRSIRCPDSSAVRRRRPCQSNTTANVEDVDGDTPEVGLISGSAHADSFSLNPDSSYTYTPNANYHGTDIFTYKAADGTADSNVATVNITATSVNHPPKRRQHHRRRYGRVGGEQQ